MIELVAGSLTFRLRTWGPDEASPLLLLGHVPDVSFSLDGLASALAISRPDRRVLSPERIDLGPDRHFQAIADDIAKLIEVLGCGRVDVLGVGFGGTVAVFLGMAVPRLVRSIALIDSPLPNLHSLNPDLVRRLSETYAYVADFLDPGFEARRNAQCKLAQSGQRRCRAFGQRGSKRTRVRRKASVLLPKKPQIGRRSDHETSLWRLERQL